MKLTLLPRFPRGPFSPAGPCGPTGPASPRSPGGPSVFSKDVQGGRKQREETSLERDDVEKFRTKHREFALFLLY